MQYVIKILMCLTLFAVMAALSPTETFANDPALCLKACIDKNGADNKQACAIECGHAKGLLMDGQRKQVDCGTQYKQCLSTCQGGDQTCRKQCRQQRTSCY